MCGTSFLSKGGWFTSRSPTDQALRQAACSFLNILSDIMYLIASMTGMKNRLFGMAGPNISPYDLEMT